MKKGSKNRRSIKRKASKSNLSVSDKRNEEIMSRSELFKNMAKKGVLER